MKIRYIFLVLFLFLCLFIVKDIVSPEYKTYQELSYISSIEKWSTYTDQTLHLSFRYPSTWQVKVISKEVIGTPDGYGLTIGGQGSSVILESSNDKAFRDVQINRIIKEGNGKRVTVNGLNFIQVPNHYYFYLEGKTPIKFQLFNFYSQDPTIFNSGNSKKMDSILNEIIHSMKYAE